MHRLIPAISKSLWQHGLRRAGLLLFLLGASPLSAQWLSPECEAELALSALPAELRDQARVHVFVDGEFQIVREGTGTFDCVVERNHPGSLIPQCLDQQGVDSILPALLDKTLAIFAGAEPSEVAAQYEKRLASGVYHAPRHGGVSYMTSPFNRIYLKARDELINVGPHVMYYAPGVTNQQIGGSHAAGMANIGLPFVLDPGPHGYLAAYVQNASDGGEAMTACGDQLTAFGF